MADGALVPAAPRRSVIVDMAERFGMEPTAFQQTLTKTVIPSGASMEQFAAFLLVAKQYSLNPLTKEIFAFPAKGGGIVPVVSVDGWIRMIQDHPQMDGLEFVDVREEGELVAVTARIYRKDRSRPVEVTEYMSECKRNTDVWKQWPARMLRHKATIQAARYAFGFSGIYDQDEAERMPPGAGLLPEPKTSSAEAKRQGKWEALRDAIDAFKNDADLSRIDQWFSENERAIDALPNEHWAIAVRDRYETIRDGIIARMANADAEADAFPGDVT